MEEMQLNTLIRKVNTDTQIFGIYYFKYNDKLFFLDIRVSYLEKLHGCRAWGKVFHYDENDECYRFDMEKMIRPYYKERSMEGVVQAAVAVVENEPEYFYNELMKILNGREDLSLEEWQNLHVESYTTQPSDPYYGQLGWKWKDVAYCGTKTVRRRRLIETCPKCGTRLIEVNMCSDGDSWHNLCGMEGMLTFCPHCQEQIRFKVELMN